MNLFDFAGRFY